MKAVEALTSNSANVIFLFNNQMNVKFEFVQPFENRIFV